MKPVREARDAETDLLEIWTFHAEQSMDAAERIVRDITAQYDKLGTFPNMGRSRAEIGPDYRSIPIGNYVIYYRVLPDVVQIARVLHGRRDITSIFPSADDASGDETKQ